MKNALVLSSLSLLLLAGIGQAAPLQENYFDMETGKWYRGGRECTSCTPENGYPQPSIMNGYYYDVRLKHWRTKDRLCLQCGPETGFPTPKEAKTALAEPAVSKLDEKETTTQRSILSRVDSAELDKELFPTETAADAKPAEKKAAAEAELQAKPATAATRQLKATAASPLAQSCQTSVQSTINSVVLDSNEVIFEKQTISEKPVAETINAVEINKEISGSGQFRIPEGWMRFSYSCKAKENAIQLVHWKREALLLWTQK